MKSISKIVTICYTLDQVKEISRSQHLYGSIAYTSRINYAEFTRRKLTYSFCSCICLMSGKCYVGHIKHICHMVYKKPQRIALPNFYKKKKMHMFFL